MPSHYTTITARKYNRDQMRAFARRSKERWKTDRWRYRRAFGHSDIKFPKKEETAFALGEHLRRAKRLKDTGFFTKEWNKDIWATDLRLLHLAARFLGPAIYKWWSTPSSYRIAHD